MPLTIFFNTVHILIVDIKMNGDFLQKQHVTLHVIRVHKSSFTHIYFFSVSKQTVVKVYYMQAWRGKGLFKYIVTPFLALFWPPSLFHLSYTTPPPQLTPSVILHFDIILLVVYIFWHQFFHCLFCREVSTKTKRKKQSKEKKKSALSLSLNFLARFFLLPFSFHIFVY